MRPKGQHFPNEHLHISTKLVTERLRLVIYIRKCCLKKHWEESQAGTARLQEEDLDACRAALVP